MNKDPPQHLVKSLLEHYKARRFNEVEKLALNLTKDFPTYIFGWKVLSVILKQKGKISEALIVWQKILKLNPNDAEAHYNTANTFKQLNRLDEALDFYKKTIALNQNYAEAYNNLALTLREYGSFLEAIKTYQKLIVLKPNYEEAYNNLGVLLKDLNRLNEAEKNFKKAIELKPTYTEAYNNLGIIFREQGKLVEAIKYYKKAIKLKPTYAEAYNNLGVVLREINETKKSEDIYKKAIELKPNYSIAHFNLAVTYRELGKLEASKASCERAIELNPAYAEAYNNLGVVLRALGNLDESEISFKKAIKHKPDYADAYNNMSLVLMQKHNFKDAFKFYEWRWYKNDKSLEKFVSSKPLWNGEQNSKVFIWKEQGIGDEIMFSSIFPEIKSISSKLIINCDKRLIPLFKRSFSKDIVYEYDKKNVNENDYDFHISMGSLRNYFRTDLNSFKKSSEGYLKADIEKTFKFKKELKDKKNQKLIGVSWDTKSKAQMAFFRTIPLNDLAIKLHDPNIKLVNLQYGEVTKELSDLNNELGIKILDIKEIDNTNDIDTLASLICACDLVVSIDNFLGLLSGSLGVDTRILLPFAAESRWGLKDKKSYIYDSVSLYRQNVLGNWEIALNKLIEDVKS